jgi:hypothetical protein
MNLYEESKLGPGEKIAEGSGLLGILRFEQVPAELCVADLVRSVHERICFRRRELDSSVATDFRPDPTRFEGRHERSLELGRQEEGESIRHVLAGLPSTA